MPARKALSALMLVFSALLFSTGGAAIKLTTLTAWQTAAFRSGIAAVGLLLFLPEARRDWKWSIWPPAVTYAATLALFVHATKLTTSADAVFLQNCAPAYLLVIGPFLLKERLRRADLWTGLLMIAGMALFFCGNSAPQATAPDMRTGNILALIAGLTWALTLTALRAVARNSGGNALPMVVAGNLIVFLVSLPQAFPVVHADTADVLTVVYLGCFQIAFAYWLLTRGVRHVPAFDASMILLLEPVANPVWSWIIHGERMDTWALSGAGLVLSGVAVQAWLSQRQAA